MKKIELKTLKQSAKELLSREQMRNIIAGSSGSGNLCTHQSGELGSLRTQCHLIPYYHMVFLNAQYCCVPCNPSNNPCPDTV